MPKTTEFVKAINKRELASGQASVVELNGTRIAIFNVDGQFYAVDDACTHSGGPLSEGELDGREVTCPWHGAVFDITTGKVVGSPAEDSVNRHEVKVEGDDVMVKVFS